MISPPRTTTFRIVSKPDRRARRWPALLMALLAVAGIAAAAGAITVGTREEAAAIFAERVEIDDRFEVVDARLTVAAADAAALGTLAAPVEIAGPNPLARTALARDHWTYGVTVRETAPASVGAGTYAVTLHADGVRLHTVHVQQGDADAAAAEGARVLFDVGTELAASSLYYIVVEALQESIPAVDFRVQSNPNGNLTWVGVGGGIDGQVNPTIEVAAGTILRLAGANGDGALHNIGIRTADGALIDPPGWSPDFGASGETATIAWTANAGTYAYQCRYHATMRGDIVVR